MIMRKKTGKPQRSRGAINLVLRFRCSRPPFTALAGEKESLFDAAILIFWPLAGLRPSRSGEADGQSPGSRVLAFALLPRADYRLNAHGLDTQ